MSGTPSPPRSVGVNMRDLGYLCLFPAMKEVIRLSSWRINDLGGVGRAIAMWVNFERTFDITMLAFPCGVDLLKHHAAFSFKLSIPKSFRQFKDLKIGPLPEDQI